MSCHFADFDRATQPNALSLSARHHTRFLPVNERDRLRSQNVLPGTIVDNTIVSNYYFDFYLNAHFGALGECPGAGQMRLP